MHHRRWTYMCVAAALRCARRRVVATALAAGGAAGLLAPLAGAAPLQRGDLLVTDSVGARVLRIDSAGQVETFSPPTGGTNLLRQPAGITVLDDGPVYVVDQAGTVIEIDRETGEQQLAVTLGGTSPWGVDHHPKMSDAELFVSTSAELHRVSRAPPLLVSFEDSLLDDTLPTSLLGVAVVPGGTRRRYSVRVAAGPEGIWSWKPAAESQVVCWGENYEGKATPLQSVSPRPPEQANRFEGAPGAATAVSTGFDHACAIEATRAGVVCWGDDSWGQSTTPAAVNASAGTATAIAAGKQHTCAIQGGSGAVICWGDDFGGLSTPPPSVNGVGGSASAIAAGRNGSCAIQTGTGAVICWGSVAPFDPPPASVDGTTGSATAIAVGLVHACAIQAGTGAVICWGDGSDGKTKPPVSVDGSVGSAIAIAASWNHTCAIQAGTGAIVCWGADNDGQSSPPPGFQARAIAAGTGHSCAVLGGAFYDGETMCWGANDHGESDPPFFATRPDDHTNAVAAGGRFSCALLEPRPAGVSIVDAPGSGHWTLDLAFDESRTSYLESGTNLDGFGGCKPGSATVSERTMGTLATGGLLRCPMSIAVASGRDEIYVADAATLLGFGGRIVKLHREVDASWSQSLLVDEATLGVPLPAGLAYVPEPASGMLGAGVLGALVILARCKSPRRRPGARREPLPPLEVPTSPSESLRCLPDIA